MAKLQSSLRRYRIGMVSDTEKAEARIIDRATRVFLARKIRSLSRVKEYSKWAEPRRSGLRKSYTKESDGPLRLLISSIFA